MLREAKPPRSRRPPTPVSAACAPTLFAIVDPSKNLTACGGGQDDSKTLESASSHTNVRASCSRRGAHSFHQNRKRAAATSSRATPGRPPRIRDHNGSEPVAKGRNLQTVLRMGLPKSEHRSRPDNAAGPNTSGHERFRRMFQRAWLDVAQRPD